MVYCGGLLYVGKNYNEHNTDKTISDYFCVLNSGNLTMAMELPPALEQIFPRPWPSTYRDLLAAHCHTVAPPSCVIQPFPNNF